MRFVRNSDDFISAFLIHFTSEPRILVIPDDMPLFLYQI